MKATVITSLVLVVVHAWPRPHGEAKLVRGCKVVGVAATFINCTGVPSTQSAANYTLFRISNKKPVHTNSTVAQYEIGLVLFARNQLDEKIGFNRNLVVGLVAFDKQCARRSTACLLELTLTLKMANLNLFQHNSSEVKFWNFQDDIYRSSDGILQELYVHFHYEGDPNWALALTNTSIIKLGLNQIRASTINLGLMPYLTSLELYDVYIESLPPDMNESTPRLDSLTSESNCFSSFSSSLRLIKNLSIVIMKGNKNCPVYTEFILLRDNLLGMDKLDYLDLSFNNLKAFEFTAFRGLTTILLSNCLITKIRLEEAVANVSRLMDLDLSHNYLTDADLKNLTYLRMLNNLDISFNSITSCPPLRNRSLHSIDASGNLISDFKTCAMKDCDISFLTLSKNDIVSWEDPLLFLKDETRNTSWLSYLDISYNPIDIINDEMIHSLDLLQVLYVSGLAINCEKCQLLKLQGWLGNTSVDVLPSVDENGPFVCRSPPEFKGMNVMKVKVNPDDCRRLTFNVISAVVIPAVSLVCLCLVVMLVMYRKRVEIMYMLHLYNLTRSFNKRGEYQRIGNEYDAFICFSSHDQKWVMTMLKPLLEESPHKYRLCLHNRDFPFGSNIIDNIHDAMERSTKTIIVLSNHFVGSQWCLWELEMANRKLLNEEGCDFVILLQLEPLDLHTLPRHLRYLMMTRTYLKWPQTNDIDAKKQALRRLIAAVGPSIFNRE